MTHKEAFIQTFQKSETPVDVATVAASGNSLEVVLLEQGLVSSKGELRRLAEAGAITNE